MMNISGQLALTAQLRPRLSRNPVLLANNRMCTREASVMRLMLLPYAISMPAPQQQRACVVYGGGY